MTTKKKFNWSKFFNVGGNSFFTMIVWELVEEGFENLIALTITNAFTMFTIKVLSTLGIVIATQTIKTGMKKFLFPIIKSYTYKGGFDKMAKFKSFMSKIGKGIANGLKFVFKSNPKASLATLTNVALTGVLGYSLSNEVVNGIFLNLPELLVFGVDILPYLIALVIFVIFQFCGINYAFESNENADARKVEEAEIKATKKAEKLSLKLEKQNAKQQQIDLKLAQALVEKRKKEAEEKAKIEEQNARIEKLANEIEANANKPMEVK